MINEVDVLFTVTPETDPWRSLGFVRGSQWLFSVAHVT